MSQTLCNRPHNPTGRLCQLPLHHISDGLPMCQNGAVRWAVGGPDLLRTGTRTDVDHGLPTRECDEGTCDCAGDVRPVMPEVHWFKPEDVTIVKSATGEILAYGVEL